MDPDIVKDEPGKCPKCGMELVPIGADKHQNHANHQGAEEDFRKRFFATLPFVLISMVDCL